MGVKILHISDLHFRAPNELDKNIYQSDPEFCKEFIGYIKKNIGGIDYLVFTGDAINQGYVKAFDDAKKFLEEIITELNIRKSQIMLCMGNHDFKWTELAEEAQEIPANASNKKEREDNIHTSNTKYKHFKSFVQDVTGKSLNVKDAIYDRIIDDNNKFMLFGVNTCYVESYEKTSHKGAIDKNQFIYKLKESLKDRPDFNVFLAMHHNPDPNAVGQDVYYWKEILLDIQKEQIKNPIVVFSGHIHYIDTSGYAQKEGQDDGSAVVEGNGKGTYYFSAGSLLNTEYKGRSFNLYEINNNTISYSFYAHLNTMKDPYWEKIRDNKITIEEQDFYENNTTKESGEEEENIPGVNKEDEDKQFLMEYIGWHKLYYSGHFHWNTDENTGNSDIKTHGYIDINYLVSHDKSLESITRLFRTKIDVIRNQYSEKLGKTIMISIGMECNVIGARLSVLFPGFDFSYIPRKPAIVKRKR